VAIALRLSILRSFGHSGLLSTKLPTWALKELGIPDSSTHAVRGIVDVCGWSIGGEVGA
jgi:hypothetical protein